MTTKQPRHLGKAGSRGDPAAPGHGQPDSQLLRLVIDAIGASRQKQGSPPLTLTERKTIGASVWRLAVIARESCGVALPTIEEGRLQIQRAMQSVKDAARAMVTARKKVRRARDALRNLDHDAIDGLFGGQLKGASQDARFDGDLAAPLSLDDYDEFVGGLTSMAERMIAAEAHAQTTGFYGTGWRRGGYHDADHWKHSLIVELAALLSEHKADAIVRKSPNGPFHRNIGLVCEMAGLPNVGQSALYGGVAAFQISAKPTNEAEVALMERRTGAHAGGR